MLWYRSNTCEATTHQRGSSSSSMTLKAFVVRWCMCKCGQFVCMGSIQVLDQVVNMPSFVAARRCLTFVGTDRPQRAPNSSKWGHSSLVQL